MGHTGVNEEVDIRFQSRILEIGCVRSGPFVRSRTSNFAFLPMRSLALLLVVLLSCTVGVCLAASSLQVSNVFGSHMVLQRAPAAAVIWGFAAPSVKVTTRLDGSVVPGSPVTTGYCMKWSMSSFFHPFSPLSLTDHDSTDGVWRQALPPMQAQDGLAHVVNVTSSDGGTFEMQVFAHLVSSSSSRKGHLFFSLSFSSWCPMSLNLS